MTLAPDGSQDRRFTTVTLPRILAGGGLLLYLTTLNHWLSLQSLGTVARVSGWIWQPQTGRPLTALVLYPFRWLPDSWIPLTLNVVHAVCAALVLALLARSVALLRYDLPVPKGGGKHRPPAIFSAPTAWMPPVLAVALCALELSFWEHATAATGEMIDVVVFAYALRCLLEFRMDRKQVWLSRAALVYGVGMANNWIMLGYFPIFIVALVLLKGLGPFLDRRFLFRMSLCGLLGLSLYLLLPALQQFASEGQVTFWPALKAHVKVQKETLELWRRPAFRALGLSSILPFILISIPWKSHSVQLADDSRLGVFTTKAMGHLVHAVFFAASLWVAFDAAFTPRALVPALPMLTFYFMSALVAGYCCGYFLVFQVRSPRRWYGKLALTGNRFLLVAVPLLLFIRNIGPISTTNGSLLRDFARQIYADLPAGKSVVLADDWSVGTLLQAECSSHRNEKQPIIVDPAAIAWPRYERFIAAGFQGRWPIPVPANRLDAVRPVRLLRLVSAFQGHEPVFFLGPPFGSLFERFSDEPHGFMHALAPRPAQGTAGDVLAASMIAGNQQLWEQRWNEKVKTLSRKIVNPSEKSTIWLRRHRNSTAGFVAVNCSKSLDYWGVQMRRGGHPAEAATWFQRAMEISPSNLAARINLEYSQRCQRGDTNRLNPVALRQEFPGLSEQAEKWGEVLVRDGPVDEPTFLFRSGRFMLSTGDSRQAAAAFARCLDMAPDWLPPKIWLAQSCLDLQDFQSALQLSEAAQSNASPKDAAQLAHLLHCRAGALLGLGRTNDAMTVVGASLAEHPADPELLSTAADLYAQGGQFDLELPILDDLLQREPERIDLLARRGVGELHAAKYEKAIASLTRALSLAPQDAEVRLTRAVAYLAANQLEPARADYETLLKNPKVSADALFGLGTVAWRQQNTNAAVRYYQQYLTNAAPKSPQYEVAAGRLAQLKAR